MISDYFNDRITIYRPMRDEWNNETTVRLEYKARVSARSSAMTGPRGEQVVASYRILLDPSAVVMTEDRIFLGVGDAEEGDQKTYHPISVYRARGFVIDHVEVTV